MLVTVVAFVFYGLFDTFNLISSVAYYPSQSDFSAGLLCSLLVNHSFAIMTKAVFESAKG